MFPDMMAPAPGYYVGVVLSSELPAADRALFKNLLSQMTDLRVQVSVMSATTPFDDLKKYLYSIFSKCMHKSGKHLLSFIPVVLLSVESHQRTFTQFAFSKSSCAAGRHRELF